MAQMQRETGRSKTKAAGKKAGGGARRSASKSSAQSGFSDLSSMASLGTVVSVARAVNWKPIGRRLLANPLQAAIVVAVGVGAVLIARRLMSGEGFQLPDWSSAGEENVQH